MHEISLMEETLNLAIHYANEQGANQIHRITLKVGTLSGITLEALELGFDLNTKGTIAEKAQLEIEMIPAIVYCLSCDLEFTPSDLDCICPRCHNLCHDLRQGKELELQSLEIS